MPPEDRWALAVAHRHRAVYLARRLGAGDDAEDVAHDVLARLATLPTLNPATFDGLLYRSVANACKNRARSASRSRDRAGRWRADTDERLTPGPDEAIVARSYARCVTRHVVRLPYPQRAALLGAAAGHSIAETAQLFGMRPNSVKTALRDARVAMRRVARGALAAVPALVWRQRRAAVASGAALVTVALATAVLLAPVPDDTAAVTAQVATPPPASVPAAHVAASLPATARPAPPSRPRAARPPVPPTAAPPAPTVVSLPTRDLGGGRSVGHTTVTVDHTEDPLHRVERCSRNGVDVVLDLSEGGVTCRDD